MTGGNVHPSVALTMSASGYEDLKFGGKFTDKNTVVGTLYGSGFSDFAITLARQ